MVVKLINQSRIYRDTQNKDEKNEFVFHCDRINFWKKKKIFIYLIISTFTNLYIM